MENQVKAMNFGQLKKIMASLAANPQVTDQTKIFIDTGWDSVQEVDPEAIHIETVSEFKVEDELNHDTFVGYSLTEKAKRMGATGEPETAIIIRNLY